MKIKMASWLEVKNLNVEIFAAQIGVSAATIYAYMRGDTHRLHRLTRQSIEEKYPDCPLLTAQGK